MEEVDGKSKIKKLRIKIEEERGKVSKLDGESEKDSKRERVREKKKYIKRKLKREKQKESPYRRRKKYN